MNQVVIVGRITGEIEKKEVEGRLFARVAVAVARSFKNADGVYETDLIKVSLYDKLADNTTEYCKTGDVIGIKGRIECLNGTIEIVADKVSFLSSTKNN